MIQRPPPVQRVLTPRGNLKEHKMLRDKLDALQQQVDELKRKYQTRQQQP